MRRFTCLLTLLCGLHLPALAAEPPPFDAPNIFGQAIWIGEGEQRMAALYAEAAAPEAKGVIILLHAEGEHPQWPVVIQSLREQLTDHGWNTLALQLPSPVTNGRDLDPRAYNALVGKRIQLAINHVMAMNPPLLVLLGHGLAANAVLQRAASGMDQNLMAVVAISTDASPYQEQALNTLQGIASLKLPILDVYGERDRSEVVDSARQRQRAARKAGNQAYRQLQIPGADLHFYAHEAMLGSRIKSWLDATYRALPPRPRALAGKADTMVPMPAALPPPPPAELPAPQAMPETPNAEAMPAESTTMPEAIPPPPEGAGMGSPTGPKGLF